MNVDVVIPVLDEAKRIGAQLEHIGALGFERVIVVDGGSRDATAALAARYPCTVAHAPRGRAQQMNRGAELGSADIILFLHCDVTLPNDAIDFIRATMADEAVVAGAFRTHTIADAGPPWSRPLLRLADVRSRYTREPYGDQCLFVRRSVFLGVGGYPNEAIMEDVLMCRRLRRRGRIVTVRADVLVSGRRFEARPVYYGVVTNLIPLLHRLGVPAALLARLYPPAR